MATKESTGTLSKSDVVREYLSSHASAPVKEVGKALAEQGVDVSIALINKIKYSDRKPTDRRQHVGRRKTVRGVDAKGTSKAQAIRDALTQLGRRTRPRDVIAHLKEGGVVVSPAQVSAVRKGFRKNGRLKHATAGSPTRANGDGILVEHLIAAKRLADQVGLDTARMALEFLVKLAP